MGRLGFVLGLAGLLGACILFASTSGFYVDNRTTFDIRVSWTSGEEKEGTAIIPALTRRKFHEATMIETDEVGPADALRSLSLFLAGETVERYRQDPVENGLWARGASSGDEDAAFDLVVSAGLLGL